MSFQDFREVSINDPGTSAFYGSDDILELMKIFNNKIVSNRRISIKNPFQFTDSFDVVAAAVTPGNPGANTKRFYVEPSNNHLIVKSTGGTTIDIDTLGAASLGEANTSSNGGTGGIGIVLPKVSADLPFKSIAAGSSKITVTDDTTNKNVDIDIAESALTLNNVGGTLGVSKGGTGLNSITANALLKGNGTGNLNLITAGTDGHILTMVSGVPNWAVPGASADTKIILFEAGTQVGTVGRRLNLGTGADFDVVEDSINDRFNVSLRRGERLVGSWNAAAGSIRTNLGTTYANILSSSGTAPDGQGCDVDGTGATGFRLYVSWSKNAGSGTHSLQVISQSSTDVLASIATLLDGRNVVTGALPAFFQDQIRSVKIQAKSTVSTDDPIFYCCHLYYK